jgi:hypothetical protein
MAAAATTKRTINRLSMITYLPRPFLSLFIAATGMGVVAAEAARKEKERWNACSTPQTEYLLQYPASLVHSTAPGATGCSFQTLDGEFNVEVAVQSKTAKKVETLDDRMRKEIVLLADTVTYKNKGSNWFVLSGITPDGTEYFRKLYTNGSQWVTLRITYPHVLYKTYGKWVTRIDKTFAPFAIRAQMKSN